MTSTPHTLFVFFMSGTERKRDREKDRVSVMETGIDREIEGLENSVPVGLFRFLFGVVLFAGVGV